MEAEDVVVAAAVEGVEDAGVEKMKVGIGYRAQLDQWIRSTPSLECVEITAEHFFDCDEAKLVELRKSCPLYVHGLGLSLGTPGSLEQKTLRQFKTVSDSCDPDWVSEHIAFTRAGGIDLGHLNPVPRTNDSLSVLTDHAIQLGEACGKPVVLENITSHLEAPGTMTETGFLNRLCDRSGCGLLLDVTNLFINSQNHGFDPQRWIAEIEPRHIVQLHIVGYGFDGSYYHDHHAALIQEEVIELLHEVLNHAPVKAVILERDDRLDRIDEIESEIAKLRAIAKAHTAPETQSP